VILNISSGAGRFTLPLLSLYAASKFALEGFSEALSHELATLNILVKIIEPGGTETNFVQTSQQQFAHAPALTDYEPFLAAAGRQFDALKGQRLAAQKELPDQAYIESIRAELGQYLPTA
jgi:short-subunit dehydrogenase